MKCRPYSRWFKRPFDVIVSGSLITGLSPLLAFISIAIRLEDHGEVFFLQRRAGRFGEPFSILKFRSMLAPEQSLTPNGTPLTNSERITRVGRILRRASLDELPQLINVLKGDMSLVGPRPALLYQVERYSVQHRGRLAVRPGITGLAQVSGRNSLTWEQKIALDLEYCRKVTFHGDLVILLKTARAVFESDGQTFLQHDALSSHGESTYLDHI